jgi:hypothetical protein
MSVLSFLTRPRVRPLDYGEAETGFLAQPRVTRPSWLETIGMVALIIGLQYLLRAAGFTALWRHYLPGWGYFLIVLALGLLLAWLRPRWHMGRRRDDYVDRAAAVLLGALLVDLKVRPGSGL